jgi:phage baseplate assembly protein W
VSVESDAILGRDLVVVGHLAAHDAQEVDLVTRHTRARGAAAGARQAALGEATDLATFSGRENLAQALILRLLTPRGSLAALGHPAYGSRLHELIGRRKDSAQRNLCRAFVLEAVAQEPRVEEQLVALDFDLAAESHDSFVFTLAVRPRSGGDPLAVSLEVGL